MKRISPAFLFFYGFPLTGLGGMFILMNTYFMKYATDVLFIAPAAMGTIFGLSRIIEAFSSPLIGYLSDRTRLKMGRRRPWMLGAALPVGSFLIMAWHPPAALHGMLLMIWMTVAISGFFLAFSCFIIPLLALGPEKTTDYRDRNRIYGTYNFFLNFGQFCGLFFMYALITSPAPRQDSWQIMLALAGATLILILVSVVTIREDQVHKGQSIQNPFTAFKDVLRNPHARLLLAVSVVDSMGIAIMSIMTVYFAQYVIGTPEKTPFYIALFMITATVSTPLWIRLADRFEKKSMKIAAFWMTGAGFCVTFFLNPDNVRIMYAIALLLGAFSACGAAFGYSMLADTVDYDEYRTGQRKEGVYFAFYFLIFKAGFGITIVLLGIVLQWVGFQPNVDQTDEVKLAIRILYAFFPLICNFLAGFAFFRYSLDEKHHRELRRQIETRGDAIVS